jgi:aminomethyltransferase
MVVVNAGMGAAIAGHLADNSPPPGVVVDDLTDKVGKMDIQGIQSARILARILKNPDTVFNGFSYFSFKGWFTEEPAGEPSVFLRDGTPVLLSRTGYTGEFGFEMFVAQEKLGEVWEMVLESGEGFGLQPCGLAARDSLRAGAVLPLSHQDIGHWPFAGTPWPFAVADRSEEGRFTKEFIGSDYLSSYIPKQYTLAFAGYDPRKIAISENSRVLDKSGEPVGTILTCTTDMAIDRVDGRIVSVATPVASGRPEDFTPRGLCCGFVKVDRNCKPGEVLFLTDGKRKLKVEIRSDIRPDRTARQQIAEML